MAEVKRRGIVRIVIGAILLAWGLIRLVTLPEQLADNAGIYGEGGVNAGLVFGTVLPLALGVLLLVLGILANRRN